MGQPEILNILGKKRGKWLSKFDFKDVGCNPNNVVRNMSKISKHSKIYGVKVKKGKKGLTFLRID